MGMRRETHGHAGTGMRARACGHGHAGTGTNMPMQQTWERGHRHGHAHEDNEYIGRHDGRGYWRTEHMTEPALAPPLVAGVSAAYHCGR